MSHNYLCLCPSTDPYYNLAMEEYLFEHYRQGTVIMLWQNDRTIVVGRNQNPLEEINLPYVKERGIQVARRDTGGGAVYHDLGNLNYTFISDMEDSEDRGMKRFAGYVIQALEELGLRAEFSGRNDILIEGKKVSGTAQKVKGSRVLHHGCLLYHTDLGELSVSLRVRPDKFLSKSVKSVRSRVANIQDFLGEEAQISLKAFEDILIRKILAGREFVSLNLSESEEEKVRRIRDEKYAAWEWIYGTPARCTVKSTKRFPGGEIEIRLDLKDGYIKTCRIYGDFMSVKPVNEVSDRIQGLRYLPGEIRGALESLSLEEYFGTVTLEELMQVFEEGLQ